MNPDSRLTAYQVLQTVESGGFADDTLRSYTLNPQEAALAQELVFGVLRHRSQLDFLIQHFSGRSGKLDPEVRTILRLGIYQLRFLDRIPPHAAVGSSVDLVKAARKRSATGFVNAVLRKVHRAPVIYPDLATELSTPPWLLARWQEHFGAESAAAIARASLEKPGRYERNGRQMDIGAQSIVPIMELEPHHRVLDLCAAPGNKALQAAESGVEPVLADRSHSRLSQIPLGRRVQLDASKPLPFSQVFDRILVDAPCSGTGTFARNPEIKWRVTPEELLRQQERQMQILANALVVLKPGGRLVYSTCSLEAEENEGVVVQFQDRLVSTGYRLPGREPGDGFFHAVLA